MKFTNHSFLVENLRLYVVGFTAPESSLLFGNGMAPRHHRQRRIKRSYYYRYHIYIDLKRFNVNVYIFLSKSFTRSFAPLSLASRLRTLLPFYRVINFFHLIHF